MKIKSSFKLKLTLSLAFIISVSFILVGLFLDKQLEKNFLQVIESSLVAQANIIEYQISPEAVTKEDSNRLEQLVNNLSARINSRISIVAKSGKVLADSRVEESKIGAMESHAARPEIVSALAGKIGKQIRYSSTLKIDMLYIALPISKQGEVLAALRLALPLESVNNTLWAVRKIILGGCLFALLLAFALGSIFSAQSVIRPVNKIINISQKFSEGDFSQRLNWYTEDEIGKLAKAIDKMAQDIEDKISQIRQQGQQISAVFNSMSEGVILVDESGCIISINPTIEGIFGIKREEAKGRFFLEAIRNNDLSEVINTVLKQGKFISRELSLVWPVQKNFLINASAIFEKDKVSGCLCVIHDITEMRRLETIRRDFVANVSHELKTPLTSIKGFVETLLEGALEDKVNSRQFLEIISKHTERLSNLINDLLELSSLESREVELQLEEFKIKALVDKVLLGFKSQLKKKSISVNNKLGDNLSVKAEKDKIEQVLTNLIDNAIKFNKENGTIEIYAHAVDKDLRVVVEDTGIGIPEKDASRIFERFYRVDKARSRELGGTGLGLSIVKHIIELHGGRVGVESTEGLGSKFFFILPTFNISLKQI